MRKISFKKLKTKTSDSVQIIRMKTMNYPANIYWSWRRLKHVFSVAIFCLPRHLKDVLKTSWRHLAKRLENMSWRRLKEVLETNKSKCAYLWSSKSAFNKSDKSKANPKCIDLNPIISILFSSWNTSSISILKTKISEIGDWPSEAIKTKF